jgi:hypothetical protein
MKKFLQLTVLVFAISALTIGCKKEADSIIGKWELENNMSVNVTHNSSNPLIQTGINALINSMIANNHFITLNLGTYEFQKNNKVIFSPPSASSANVLEGTYTITDKTILSVIIPNFSNSNLTGEFTVSSKTLQWDIDMFGVLDVITDDILEELLKDFEELGELLALLGDPKDLIKGITGLVVRATFRRV